MPKKVKNITNPTDYDELSKAYKFVLEDDKDAEDGKNKASTWQDRMVIKYHEYLYKSHVIADLSRFEKGGLGLRWRTKYEVSSGKGDETCGNKHCSCYYDNERKRTIADVKAWKDNPDHSKILNRYFQSCERNGHDKNESELQRLEKVPHGLGLFDYEVHFAYEEHGEKKEELVNLKLCLRCAPKLFFVGKGYALGARAAREKQMKTIPTPIQEDRIMQDSDASLLDAHMSRKRSSEKHDDQESKCGSSPEARSRKFRKVE